MVNFGVHWYLNYQGPRITTTAPNLGSAYENPDVVDDKLRKERELGRIAGPFDSPPFENLHISPLALFPRKRQANSEWFIIYRIQKEHR